ncbi:MAG: phosphatase PAP2 family protein [Ruminococcus sp.]|nr:phosphatase PAP2 family protein [Ruminococcus sp.]
MIQQFDFAILDWIQANLKCGFLDFLMPKITLLGEYGIFLILIGIALLFWRSHRVCGIAELSGLAGGFVIGNILLKNLVARQRPCWINTDVAMLVAVPADYSFPSGHTLHCFIAATVLFYYDRRLGIPAAVMAVMVAFSRLYLYVHFPTDVLAGAVLGVAIGAITICVVEAIRKRMMTKKDSETV